MVEDYSKIGLKSGLEIHQQLDTKKLFCNCNSVLRSDEPSFKIRRRLHAVPGEGGKVDVAAEYQSELKKEFIYEGYDSVCLVELDEEPPHEINKDALKIAIGISLYLNCKIIPISQIMRKTVVDGSNTSGFQRTVLIAINGHLDTSFGRVGIESVCLEEDSARIIERGEKEDVFRLDRLGIPLVEIATSPDIKSPEQAKEVALKIGEILRSFKVRRGLGTIRQDVNLSIKGGKRIELKGFQDIKNIEVAMKKEIERQKELVKKGKSISEVRNVRPDGSSEFLRPMPGASRMYPETDLTLLKIPRELINEVKQNLPKLKKEVEEELRKQGLTEEMIKLLFKRGKLEEYKELLKIYNHPNFVAKTLLLFPSELAKRSDKNLEYVEKKLGDLITDIIKGVSEKKIDEEDIKLVMERILKGKSLEDSMKIEKADRGEIEERIREIISEKKGLSENAYMGLIMQEFKGKISGKEAREIIKKYLE